MKRNKIIIKVLATIVVMSGLLPNDRVFAQTNNQTNNSNVATIVQGNKNQGNGKIIETQKIETTTSSSVIIEDIETVCFNMEVDKVNKVLSNFKTTNNTNEEEIINAVNENVDSSINIFFGTEEGQRFIKVDATTEAEGEITATLIISNLNEVKEIPVNLSIERLVEFKDDVLTTLKARIIGLNSNNNLNIGKITSVKVTGYNSNNEEVVLDENKLKYKWFANGKLVGMKKELKITSNMDEEFITCEVEYPDEEKGGF